MAVRTPMQWHPGAGGGFSTASADRIVRPFPGGALAPAAVNVADQRRDPRSLLAFMTKLAHARREAPEFGWGESTLLENEPPSLFAHRCDWQDSTVLAVHNLADTPVAADLELGDDVTGVDDLLELREHRVTGGRLHVELDGYGYLWLRARRA